MEQALPLEPLQGLRVPGGTPLSDILVSDTLLEVVYNCFRTKLTLLGAKMTLTV